MDDAPGQATHGEEYADRLIRLQTARWKRLLNVQALHRWTLRRLNPGFTLDIGCGIGRNLLHLRGQGIGIDINEHCVRAARTRGLTAFTPDEFRRSPEYNRPGLFDTILLAHVAEHMTEDQAAALLEEYVPLLGDAGRLILIAPQEAGFRSDPTHIALMDFAALGRIAERVGFEPERAFSCPLPRWTGRWFTYNEFVVVSRKPARGGRHRESHHDHSARQRDRRQLEWRGDAARGARFALCPDLAGASGHSRRQLFD